MAKIAASSSSREVTTHELGGMGQVAAARSAIFSAIASAGRMYDGRTRRNGAPRHVGVEGGGRLLDDDAPAGIPDSLRPGGAVAARSGEKHRHGALLQLRGERAEKAVNRVVRRVAGSGSSNRSSPSRMTISRPAGITQTVSGRMGIPSSTVATVMVV